MRNNANWKKYKYRHFQLTNILNCKCKCKHLQMKNMTNSPKSKYRSIQKQTVNSSHLCHSLHVFSTVAGGSLLQTPGFLQASGKISQHPGSQGISSFTMNLETRGKTSCLFFAKTSYLKNPSIAGKVRAFAESTGSGKAQHINEKIRQYSVPVLPYGNTA